MSLLRPHPIDWSQIERFIRSAEKKLETARKLVDFDEEASLQQAYEAMLKASIGLMLSHGSRVRSQAGHQVAIIEFARKHLDARHGGLLSLFDRLRRKRNAALYDDAGLVSRRRPSKRLRPPVAMSQSFGPTSPLATLPGGQGSGVSRRALAAVRRAEQSSGVLPL
jgi:hypothetical protein